MTAMSMLCRLSSGGQMVTGSFGRSGTEMVGLSAAAVRIQGAVAKAAARRRGEEALGLVGIVRPGERTADCRNQVPGERHGVTIAVGPISAAALGMAR